MKTRATELFGTRHPIVQTGMGWVSDARLTAATSEAGGLGILAAATLTLSELDEAVAEIQETTDRPFGVNLRADQEDIDQRLELLIRAGVRVASFARAPGPDAIARLKEAGLITLPTVGARRHAEKVEQWGVDALIAQGGEGGGHTGSIPTSLLLPDVCSAVSIPVLGAGGFRDGRGLVAALAFGADGIAMGTRFLLTQESPVPEHVKQRYLATGLTETVRTTAIDGVPQRVIQTESVAGLEAARPLVRLWRALNNASRFRSITQASPTGLLREALATDSSLTPAQLVMAANAPMLTRASMVDGNLDVGILPTGQVVGLIERLPTVAELIDTIMREAEDTLARIAPEGAHV